MRLYKKLFLFQSVFFGAVIVLIFSLNSCINSCDNTNSTVVKIEIDTAGKAFPIVLYKVTIDNIIIDTFTRSIPVALPLNVPLSLNQDSTVITFFRNISNGNGTAAYKLVLSYTAKPYLPGPDCGVDMRINNLQIRSHNFTEDKKPILSTDQVTTSNAPNVKIRL